MAIRDPNEIDMERRLLAAMVLSMAVLFLASYFYQPAAPGPLPRGGGVAEEQAARRVETESLPELAAPQETVTTAKRRTVEIENDQLILRWSNAGGILTSAQLKDYASAEGTPLEIIPQGLPEAQSQALGVRVGDKELDRRLAAAIYEIEGRAGDQRRAPAEISFVYRDDQVEVRRTVRIPETGYLFEMTTEVRSGNRSIPFSVLVGPGIGQIPADPQGDFGEPGAAYYLNGSVERITLGDVEEEPVRLGSGAHWLAMDSKYFAYAVLDSGGMLGGRAVQSLYSETNAAGDPEAVPLLIAEARLEPGSEYTVFIGPKRYETLQAVEPTLGALIDYGFFSILVRPLVLSLQFVYGYVGNYGWAIIILTFIINLVLFPVRYKQMVSMKKMSILQPQVKAIQEKYKGMKRADPRRSKMNEEVMGYYKEHGVNPLAGCLPLLLQMPFLFAFYRMLYTSLELRGANFISWWIPDLSEPNIILTLMMGLSMVLQQKMTPATGDPTQRKMMMALPIVFTFFFLSLSSGLVLYFLFSNLFGMMLQVAFQRFNPELAATAPKQKSTKKKVKASER
jgi:YidC/Oxa1 family membrane protein insertase